MSEQEEIQTPTVTQTKKRPQFVNDIRVKMPQDYDFNTWGKDYSQYKKDFRLRTDAVYEKYALKDWFRLVNKLFYFNRQQKKYQFIEPEDDYSTVIEAVGIEATDVMNWPGYSPTGSTRSYQVSVGAKQVEETTFNTFYQQPDYYMACAMKFEKWFRCDSIYGKDRTTLFDRNPKKAQGDFPFDDTYPCFREWAEINYACADNIMQYLLQLAYTKRAQNFWMEDASSVQIRSFPTIFDTPSEPERITYTY